MACALAGKAAAASAISAIVRKSFDYLDRHTKAEGMKSVKERLERTLPQVQLIFDAIDTEQIREQSEALDAWLWQLRDAVEEAEDALDEVEYYKLEKKVKSGGNKVSSSLYKCKRLLIQQFNTTFSVGTFKRMVDAMRKLDEAAVGAERFILLVDQLDSCSLRHICHLGVVNPRESSSFLIEETLIGRDTEKDQIIESLIKQGADNQNLDVCNVSLFGLVGLGGMGKTTLVQAVYNDQRVKHFFDSMMWVCVSNDFNVPALTRKIVEETTGQGTDVTCLNQHQEILRVKLGSKKFLLVLDDVWNDNKRPDWEKLVAPLKLGRKGSKILLTTRMQSVVDIAERVLGGKAKSMRLEGLQENDLLALLYKHAFFGVNPNNYVNLQEIGKQIIKKLSRSPLAAKVMGGLLNNSMDSIHWNKMLRQNISNVELGNEGVMMVLRLSYHHLPSQLQACFRYCSIFEEDHIFIKEDLVDLWMGSGLIQLSGGEKQSLEDVGGHYLSILTKKSFFELRSYKSTKRYDDRVNAGELSDEYYVLHDLLHELARTVSIKECVRISSNDYGILPKTIRHASIMINDYTMITEFSILKKLRTLLISFDRKMKKTDQWTVLKNVLNAATKLRVFHVQTCSLRNPPDTFGNLLHLRHLCHYNYCPSNKTAKMSFWFPCSIYKLYHLQMLKLRCSLLSWRLGNLVSLKHLYSYSFIIGLPPYFGQLTSLQDVRYSCVPHRHGLFASELQNLKDLRYLGVNGLENIDKEEAVLIKLPEKENLNVLSISWQSGKSEADIDERVLNDLQPHMNLVKLKIKGYNGCRSPCWMESPYLTSMTYISLSQCHNLQNLPPLGLLPSLKYLHLTDMKTLQTINSSFYGCKNTTGFPSLEILHIEDLPALYEWVETENSNLFPRLEVLSIIRCKALRHVPTLPCTLAYFELYDVGLTTLPAIYRPTETTQPLESSLFNMKISHCPNLVTLEEELYLFGLEELHVTSCNNLIEMPMDRLQALSFLNTLVLDFPKLTAPQADICLPVSIRNLHFGSCGVYESYLLKYLCTLTSLTNLRLHNCAMKALPSAELFRNLTTLRQLGIVNCRELAALDGIEGLTNVRELTVSGCYELDRHIGTVSQQMFQGSDLSQVADICHSHLGELEKLRIGSPFLLQWEPLRRVNSVTHLTIDDSHRCLPEQWLMQNRNHLKHLGVLNATNLEFLPSTMTSLASLETLSIIHRAVLLQSLPELPACLKVLQIFECHPALERRCRKRIGCDWHKIKHISDLEILQGTPKAPYIVHYYTGSYRLS